MSFDPNIILKDWNYLEAAYVRQRENDRFYLLEITVCSIRREGKLWKSLKG